MHASPSTRARRLGAFSDAADAMIAESPLDPQLSGRAATMSRRDVIRLARAQGAAVHWSQQTDERGNILGGIYAVEGGLLATVASPDHGYGLVRLTRLER